MLVGVPSASDLAEPASFGDAARLRLRIDRVTRLVPPPRRWERSPCRSVSDGFLAAGLAWGAVASEPVGFQVEVSFLLCVAVAGLY